MMILVRDKIVEIALNEVGYVEKASDKDLDNKKANAGTKDYTKYGKWFGSNPGPWCSKFVCWVYNQAGYLNLIKKTASCGSMLTFFKKEKEFQERGYKPVKADIIFINWDSKTTADHVGIVWKVDNKYVYTIEGNRGNKVAEAKYLLTDTRILGYGTPKFSKYEIGEYIVNAKVYLKVRTGPGFDYDALKFEDLTCEEKLTNLELTSKKYNGLVKDSIVNVDEIKNNWGKIDKGWICLDYCIKKTD